ncbi:TetR/AcrR family transcriptional regulator [Ottowia sp. VDI28]|uniref:TetR/AcrR family transcriptional regulator n=1 Tax=Ottowia sp. VDI28 TaxID=3133968 RepID=UPI003C3026F2
MTKSIKPRRKPSQSRAWMTASAIQDAFLISLVENGYERVSMRDIANVAGVGLGTLYLYFPNKESIAAVTLRGWLRSLASDIEAAVGAVAGQTLRGMADAMVAADLERMYQAPEQWRVLLLLERRITEPAVYQEMFQYFVGKLADGFSAAEDLPPDVDPRPLAFVAFSTMNGIIRDTMQVLDVMPDRDMLLRVVQGAVWGSIASMLGHENTVSAQVRPLRRR